MTPGGGGAPCVNPARASPPARPTVRAPVTNPDTGRSAGDPADVKNCKTNSAAFCRRAAPLFASPFDLADLTRARKSFQTAKTEGTFHGPTCVQRHRGRGAPKPRRDLPASSRLDTPIDLLDSAHFVRTSPKSFVSPLLRSASAPHNREFPMCLNGRCCNSFPALILRA